MVNRGALQAAWRGCSANWACWKPQSWRRRPPDSLITFPSAPRVSAGPDRARKPDTARPPCCVLPPACSGGHRSLPSNRVRQGPAGPRCPPQWPARFVACALGPCRRSAAPAACGPDDAEYWTAGGRLAAAHRHPAGCLLPPPAAAAVLHPLRTPPPPPAAHGGRLPAGCGAHDAPAPGRRGARGQRLPDGEGEAGGGLRGLGAVGVALQSSRGGGRVCARISGLRGAWLARHSAAAERIRLAATPHLWPAAGGPHLHAAPAPPTNPAPAPCSN